MVKIVKKDDLRQLFSAICRVLNNVREVLNSPDEDTEAQNRAALYINIVILSGLAKKVCGVDITDAVMDEYA